MRRILALVAVAAATAAVFAAASLSGGSAVRTRRGAVGPGFTISLTSGGPNVTA